MWLIKMDKKTIEKIKEENKRKGRWITKGIPIPRSKESIEKQRRTMLGRKQPKETIRKMLETKKKNGTLGPCKEAREKTRLKNIGQKRSEETKRKMSEKRMGFKQSEDTKEKISKANKGKERTEEFCKRMSEHAKRRITDGTMHHVFLTIGNNETEILDCLEKEKGVKIERQYPILHYFVDGYDKENNIVFEVDEKAHRQPCHQKREWVREQNIVNELNCEVIRIKDY